MVVHSYGSEYHVKDVGCYLQGQGLTCIIKIKRLFPSAVFSELMMFLTARLSVMVNHHKPEGPVKILDCCVYIKGITLFMVKVTANVQNYNCLSERCLFNC